MINHNKNEDENEKEISHRNNINKPRYRHRYRKYRKCLSMVMFICIIQHLSNINNTIREKVKQH